MNIFNYKDKKIIKDGMEARKYLFTPGNPISNFLACTRQVALIIGSNLFVHAGILPHIANKYKKTPAQIMLKWGLNNNYHIMPRSSNNSHIIDNNKLDFELNDNDMEELNNIDITHITHPKYKLF